MQRTPKPVLRNPLLVPMLTSCSQVGVWSMIKEAKRRPREHRWSKRVACFPAWLAIGLALAACTGSGTTGPAAEPAGRPESAKTKALETGAATLQTDDPLEPMNVYLVGFQPLKDDRQQQFEAHHFCTQVNEDFAQCALFDGNTAEANLNGIECIISERLFERLPEKEKPYWHPHNGEILSGQLVAPGLPEIADKELMRSKLNSYGKT